MMIIPRYFFTFVILLACLRVSSSASASFGLYLFFGEDESDEVLLSQLQKHEHVGKAGVAIFSHELPKILTPEQLHAMEFHIRDGLSTATRRGIDLPSALFVTTNSSAHFYSMPWWELVRAQTVINRRWVQYRHIRNPTARSVVDFVRASIPYDVNKPVKVERETTKYMPPALQWRRRKVKTLDDFTEWCLSGSATENRVCVVLVCDTKPRAPSTSAGGKKRKKKKSAQPDVNWKMLGKAVDTFNPQHASFSFMWVKAGSPVLAHMGFHKKDSVVPRIALVHPSSNRLLMYPDNIIVEHKTLTDAGYFSLEAAPVIEHTLRSWDVKEENFDAWKTETLEAEGRKLEALARNPNIREIQELGRSHGFATDEL